MKFFGFELEIGRGCRDCERKDIEINGLRAQNGLLAEHQLVLLDTIMDMRKKIEKLEGR